MMSIATCARRIARPVVPVLLLALAGCGARETTATGGGNYARMRAMSNLYSGYLATHKGRSPPDEQAFRAYLGSKQEDLQKMGLTIDEMFVSPRSGQPLQWIYGKSPPAGKAGMKYFAFEKTPDNDKRLVLATGGMSELMNDAEFRSVFRNSP